ncbi:hypothetical protein [Delftia lacustris]|uniref:hypothetical protein n=1 Tax=Delftia lacustris TaxID=558537 RepID=UPI00115FB26A|nr:hypothetical protein [Delftia lacustris]
MSVPWLLHGSVRICSRRVEPQWGHQQSFRERIRMTTTVLPLWLEFIKAVAPLLAALLAAGVGAWVAHKFGRIQESIARQQAETAKASSSTARNKLKLDLFDRRMAIYKAAADAISIAGRQGDFSTENEYTFESGVQGARWLFGNDVVAYIEDELRPLFGRIRYAASVLEDQESEQGKQKAAVQKSKIIIELMNHRSKVDSVFAEYLRLET